MYSSDDGLNANGSSTGAMGGFGGMSGMDGLRGSGTEESNQPAGSESDTPPDMSGEAPGTTTAGQTTEAAGTEVLSYTPQCSYSSVAFSAPELTIGETYTVCVGETNAELTLSEMATQVGENSGMGGMGDMGKVGGGMQPGDMRHGDAVTPPEQGKDGTDDFSERPTPPDWDESGKEQSDNHPFSRDSGKESAGDSTERPTPPDDGNGFGGMGENPGLTQDSSDFTGESTAETTSVSAGTWLLLGAAVLVLAAGMPSS